jgi:microcystin-dependent protein
MKITSYFYDMGTSQNASAPHYLAIPSDSNRITGNNLNAAHVIRNNDTSSGSICLEFVNTSDAFNTNGGQNPNPTPISEIKDIKLSNYNLKVGGEQNVYISKDKIKIGPTTYIGSTGAVINGNLDVKGTGTFNGKITGNSDAYISGSIGIDGLATMNGGAVGKVDGIKDVYLGCPIGTVVMWVGQTAPEGWFLCNGDRILIKNSIPVDQKIQDINFKQGDLQNIVNILSDYFGAAFVLTLGTGSGRYYVKNTTINDTSKTIQYTETTDNLNEAYRFYDEHIDYTLLDSHGQSKGKAGDYFYIIRNLPDLRQKFPLGAVPGKIGSDPNGYATNLGKIGGEDVHKLTIDEMPSHNHSLNRQLSPYNTTYETTDDSYNATHGYTTEPETYILKINETGGSQPHNNIPPFLAINFIIKYK